MTLLYVYLAGFVLTLWLGPFIDHTIDGPEHSLASAAFWPLWFLAATILGAWAIMADFRACRRSKRGK